MGIFDSSQQTKNKPWGPAGDLMKSVLKDAKGYYNSGKAGNTFTKPTIVGYGKDIKSGLTGLSALAGANSGGAGLSGQAQGIINNGGFTGGQTDAIAGLKGLAENAGVNELINGNGLSRDQNVAFDKLKGTVDRNNAAFQDTFDRGGFSAEGRAALDDLSGNVAGNNAALQQTFDTGGLTDDQQLVANRFRTGMNEAWGTDPAYNAVKDQAMREQKMALDANAAKGGRYGGGASQTILAREQGNLGARLDANELDKWRARTAENASGLAALSQQGTSNQLGINSAQQAGTRGVLDATQLGTNTQLGINSAQVGNLGAVSDTAQRGVDNRSNAINLKSGLLNSVFNAENAGLDRMGQAYDLAQAPSRTQMEVGAMRDAQRQNVRNDEIRMFDAQNPMNIFQQFMGLANGTPTSSTTTANPSWAQLLAGGGLSGLAALGGLAGWGSGGSATTGASV